MPTNRREELRERRMERQNGGSNPESSMSQNLREGWETAGRRMHEGYDSARHEMERRYREAEGVMARNPAPSVLIALGAGFGLGLVITTMLNHSEESWSDWSERRTNDGMRMARRSMGQAQDAMNHLPGAFHSLADSIRNLPSAIASHLPSAMMRR